MSEHAAVRPARLQPIFVPRIWGAKSLAPLFSDKTCTEKDIPKDFSPRDAATAGLPIGEVWLSEGQCKFADGPYEGRALADAWREMSAGWTGTQFAAAHDGRDAPFPLLAKFLFPGDKLSVQVHPPDEYAAKNEAAAGGVGKTEMWYAVDAQPGTEVLVGLKPGVTRQVFRRAIDEATAENCLARVPMSRGDAVFVPAGTAHTIGQGLVLCEIQQTSDITYRVYDYGRVQPNGTPRKLHVTQAMEVLNFDSQRGGKLAPARIAMPEGERIALVACKYFAVEKWRFSKGIALKTAPERFEIWIAIAGDGKISWSVKGAGGTANYSAAESWFVPAALGEWRIEPTSETTMLRVFVPDLKGYAAELAASGVSSEDSAQVIRK